jgi:hypothetical protein
MARTTGPGLLVVGVLTAALSKLIVAEIEEWSPLVIRSLIKFAVGQLPENQRERYKEEWQSHVNDVPGQVGKLVVAGGFLYIALNVTLTGRLQLLLEHEMRLLAEPDEGHSISMLAVKLIQSDETLASQEGISCFVNDLRSSSSARQKNRSQLANLMSTVSLIPPSLNLSYTRILYQLWRLHKRTSREAKEYIEMVARIVNTLEEWKRRRGH